MIFRPELQGIRGLAILLVVMGHAGVPGVSGGFIGVDLFFVLSGFLITRLLLAEYQASGRIDFAGFYFRRLKRLLPALLLMVACVSVAVYLILEPVQQGQSFISAVTALLWSSNIHFALQDQDYFARQLDDPFLHTWSLGVEEQFYLVWPLLVSGMAWLGARRGKATQTWLWALASITGVSAGLAWWWTSHDPAAAYYLPFTRFWQFTVGALVAVPAVFSLSGRYQGITGVAGLILVLLAAGLLDARWPYPGLVAWLPTAGAVLLVLAVAQPSGQPLARLLSWRPLVWVGDRSYGWYLWHWPLLVLTWAVWPAVPLWGNVLSIVLALGVAGVSLVLVENPLRFGRLSQQRTRYVSLSAAMLMTVVGLQVFLYERGYEQSTLPELEEARKVLWDQPDLYLRGCDQGIRSSAARVCAYGEAGAPALVVLGDSVSAQWTPALLGLQDQGWRILVITKSNCPMLAEAGGIRLGARRTRVCSEWRDNVVARLRTLQPALVIVSSHDGYPVSLDGWRDGTRALLAQLTELTDRVLIIRSTPTLPFDSTSCIGNRVWQERVLSAGWSHCSATIRSQETDAVFAVLSAVAEQDARVQAVDLNGLVCPDGTCTAVDDRGYVFRDRRHLTRSYVHRHSQRIRAELGLASPQAVD